MAETKGAVPIPILRNYLVKIYNDFTFKVGHYFDKKDLKAAAKEYNIRHAMALSAASLEEVTKLAEELADGVRKLDSDIDTVLDQELQNDTSNENRNS